MAYARTESQASEAAAVEIKAIHLTCTHHSIPPVKWGCHPCSTFLPKEGPQEIMQGQSLHQISAAMLVMLNQTLAGTVDRTVSTELAHESVGSCS